MLVFFSVSILVLTVLATPIMITVQAGADVLENAGYVRVYLFFIPVYRASAELEHVDAKHNNLLLRRGNKTEEIHINTDRSDKRSIMRFFKKVPILSAVRVRNLTVDMRIGFGQNALATTMATAGARTAFLSVASVLKSREDMTVRPRFTPAYNAYALTADVFGIISLSLANIIYSLIRSIKER